MVKRKPFYVVQSCTSQSTSQQTVSALLSPRNNVSTSPHSLKNFPQLPIPHKPLGQHHTSLSFSGLPPSRFPFVLFPEALASSMACLQAPTCPPSMLSPQGLWPRCSIHVECRPLWLCKFSESQSWGRNDATQMEDWCTIWSIVMFMSVAKKVFASSQNIFLYINQIKIFWVSAKFCWPWR